MPDISCEPNYPEAPDKPDRPPLGWPGDRIAEFLDNANARWPDIDAALEWFAANKARISKVLAIAADNEAAVRSIVASAAKLAAFLDTLLPKEPKP